MMKFETKLISTKIGTCEYSIHIVKNKKRVYVSRKKFSRLYYSTSNPKTKIVNDFTSATKDYAFNFKTVENAKRFIATYAI